MSFLRGYLCRQEFPANKQGTPNSVSTHQVSPFPSEAKIEQELETSEEKQDESQVLKLTQDCVQNLSSIMQNSIFEKNENYLKRKVQSLAENVNTSPDYLAEIIKTKQQLFQQEVELENELIKNEKEEMNQQQLNQFEKNNQMKDQLEFAEQMVMRQILEVRSDICLSHLKSLFQLQNLRFLKKILAKCQEEIAGIAYEKETPQITLSLAQEKLSKYSKKVLPSFISIREEERKAVIQYQFLSERDLALEILIAVTGLEARENRSEGLGFLCILKKRKREEKFESKMATNPLVKQVKKLVELIEHGEDKQIKSGRQSLLRKNRFNKSHLEINIAKQEKENVPVQAVQEASDQKQGGKRKRKTWDKNQ